MSTHINSTGFSVIVAGIMILGASLGLFYQSGLATNRRAHPMVKPPCASVQANCTLLARPHAYDDPWVRQLVTSAISLADRV